MPKTHRVWTIEEENLLSEVYGKKSHADLICLFPRHTLQAILERASKKLKLDGGRPGEKRKHVVNDNFFSPKNIINCYWAGFIAADGSISRDLRQLSIALAIRDTSHLDKFARIVSTTIQVQSYSHYKFPSSKVVVTSPQMVSDLKEEFRIGHAKTHTLQHPDIEDNLQKAAYIAGYFDGDGSFPEFTRRGSQRISFVGTESMMFWIAEYMNELNPERTKQSVPARPKNKSMFEYQKGIGLVSKWIQTCLSLGIPLLDRKWDRLKEYA